MPHNECIPSTAQITITRLVSPTFCQAAMVATTSILRMQEARTKARFLLDGTYYVKITCPNEPPAQGGLTEDQVGASGETPGPHILGCKSTPCNLQELKAMRDVGLEPDDK